MAKSILKQMNKIFKNFDKVWFAFFAPLTVYGYFNHGVTPLWLLSTVTGVCYISLQIYHALTD